MNKWLVSMSAAAVAAGAMAVSSENIVGVLDKDADEGVYTPVTVPMASVGLTTIAIEDITFDGIARGDSLQIFGNDGDVAIELFKTKTGWKDDNDDDASDWAFEPGDSFWINPKGQVAAKFPGEVSKDSLTITADAGVYTPFGNGTAGAVAIENITFDGIARGDSLQIFGNDGDVATELFKTKTGWKDDNDDDASDWVFQPGDSFWINPKGEVEVEIPAAI